MRTSSRPGKARRTIALSVTAGILALTGPTLSAAAAQPGNLAIPPPLNPGVSASSAPLTPLPGFTPKQTCMQSNPGNSVIERTPWSQRVLGFEEAHSQQLTGKNQKIAVIDTGVNPHPRLPRLEDGGSSVPDGGALKDCDGHGTSVAGIAAARPDPNTGFVGVAPESTVLSLRQSSGLYQKENTGETVGNTITMAQAINHAVQRGADVINISQSSCQQIRAAHVWPGNQELHTAVFNAYQSGAVVVAAAGNVDDKCQKNPTGSPTTAVLPAWFDQYVLTVASVNQQGSPSPFTVPGPWVDVAAPGENLISLDPGQNGKGLASQISGKQGGQPQPLQGTSYATPYVSGLVALIKQKYPTMDPKTVMERVEKTSLHPGGNDGRNDIVGYGMIDPMAALNNVVPAEHGIPAAPIKPTRLDANVLPKRDWPAILIALGGAGGGLTAVIFTAFLVNAVRSVRARQAGSDSSGSGSKQ